MPATGTDADDLRALARAAYDLVGDDDARALQLADEVVASVPVEGASAEQLEAASMAHRAAGLALYQRPDLVAAEARLRVAVSIAAGAGLTTVEAEAAMSLAFILLERGQPSEALRVLDEPAGRLDGVAAARLGAQRALVLQELGRGDEALTAYAAALPVLEAEGDLMWEARLRNNRAQLLAYRGHSDAAEVDMVRAHDIVVELGMTSFVGQSLFNLGWLAGVAGRVPEALRLLDRSAEVLGDDDQPLLWLTRATVLMRAGLFAESAETAARVVAWLDEHEVGWAAQRAEAELMAAQASLRAGRLDDAVTAATRASSTFEQQQRGAWVAMADYVLARARVAAEDGGGATDGVLSTMAALTSAGWDSHAIDLQVAAADAAMRGDRRADARTLLAAPLDVALTTVEARARAAHREALLHLLDDDLPAFSRSLSRAWRFSEQQRAVVGATELRAMVAAHTGDLVRLGLDEAVARRSPAQAFAWAERGRAAVLRYPPPLPPDDDELATALAALRVARERSDELRLGGEDASAAAAHVAACERDVVRLTRTASGGSARIEPVSLAELRSRLGDRVLVEYLRAGSSVVALVVTAARARLVEIGSYETVRATVDRAEFVVRRMASGHSVAGAGAGAAIADVARRLDELLLAPVRELSRGSDLVVAPTGDLWRVPWSLLPSAAGRPLRVVPSATVFCDALSRATPLVSSVLAVAGPRLAAAAREVEDVARAHEKVDRLTGPQATVESVLAGLATADVAHLAVHGELRQDNPLFSSLELVDGALTGYDLEALPRVPRVVVLPACHSGRGRSLAGDEMLGLAWTLLGAGATTVVATTTAVPDEASADLMGALHRHLGDGLDAATALSRAQAAVDPDDPLAVATAASFVSVGA